MHPKRFTRKYKNHTTQIEYYESASDVARLCETRSITNDRFDNIRLESFDSWRGVSSYDEAIDYMKNGYQPIVENMRGVFKANRHNVNPRFKFQNEVVGFAPIVPLAMMRIPNSMVNMRVRPIKTKVLDVYYDMTDSCNVSSDDIIKAGQTLLGGIVELEAQGYRFNLYAVQTYCSREDCDMLVVKVKSSTQPLDLKRVSFPLCHTAFFRVIGFDWYSKVPDGKYRLGYGHAAYHEFNNDTDKYYRALFGQNAVCLSGANIRRAGKEHIKEVLTNDSKN